MTCSLFNISWGVDGCGRAHLTTDGVNAIFCGLDGVSGVYLSAYYKDKIMSELLKPRDLSYKPLKEPLEVKAFKIVIRDTEYFFDDYEEAKLFKLGYEHGFDQKEPISMTRSYKGGYQVGVNDLARGQQVMSVKND